MEIKWFNTERQAIKTKRKLKGTKNYKWTVQGNALVPVIRKTPRRKTHLGFVPKSKAPKPLKKAIKYVTK